MKVYYFEGLLAAMWQYRFSPGPVPLPAGGPTAGRQLPPFVQAVLVRGTVIYEELRSGGIIEVDEEQLQGLMVNTWIIMSTWAALVHGLRPDAASDEALDEGLMRHGIYQIICLEEPFLRSEARDHLQEMKDRYRSADSTMQLLMGFPMALAGRMRPGVAASAARPPRSLGSVGQPMTLPWHTVSFTLPFSTARRHGELLPADSQCSP